MNVKLLIHILFLIIQIQTKPCTKSNYKQYFSKCNITSNKRNITIYKDSECENPDNKTLQENELLLIYSQLPTFETTCNKECKSGEKLQYNPITNELNCISCPNNTYILGNDYKIISNWKKSDLKKFIYNCYAIDYNGFKVNEDCTGLSISSDKSMLMSGELTSNHIKYFIQVLFFFNTQNYGRFILKYRKDSYEINGFVNGNFKLYFDYEIITYENDKNTDWITVYQDFSPGEHEFVIFYWYIRNNNNNIFRFYIENLEIIGFENNSYECKSCENLTSDDENENCFSCEKDYYFDNKSNNCIKCQNDEFSISNNYNLNKCFKKIKCNEFDYEITNIGNCVNNKKNITLSPIYPIYCNDFEEKIIKEVSCDDKILNIEGSENCRPGMIYTSYFEYIFKDNLINKFFDKNDGFKSNDNYIFIGNYLNDVHEKVLQKTIYFKTSGYINIKLDLNLDESEILKIKINSHVDTLTGIENDIEKKYIVKPGEVSLTFIYEKSSNFLKFDNSIIIKEIKIYGSEISKDIILIKCPKGTISKDQCLHCVYCNDNEIPDEKQSQCIKCKNGLHSIINDEYKCIECPPYTYYDGNKCLLNEVIFQENDKLRFNLYPIKEYIFRLCNDQSGLLCYDNAFIGPISDFNQKENSIQRNLFFISLFEPKNINITDFTYNEDLTSIKNGHIFGLFTVNQPQMNNEFFLNPNLTYDNTKLKKNLGKSIKKIEIVDQERNSFTELGLLMEFNEGDACITDKNKNYKVYLYLKCNKFEISSPKLINIKDNNCTYIFEWNSPYACKNCIVQDLITYERGTCKNGIRKIFFDSNEACLIFNISGTKLKGNEIFYDELLSNSASNLYINIIGNKNNNNNNRNLNTVKYKKNDFDFDYIESNIYTQKCSFFENIDDSWKKYLLIIPLLYLITFIGVVIYYCKYKKIKDKYQRLNTNTINNNSGEKHFSETLQLNKK